MKTDLGTITSRIRSEILDPELKRIIGATVIDPDLIRPSRILDSIMLVQFLMNVQKIWNNKNQDDFDFLSPEILHDPNMPTTHSDKLAILLAKRLRLSSCD